MGLIAMVLPATSLASPYSTALIAAWATNTVELDEGTCGQMLQVGSDPTASSSATPSFFLKGDGGLSAYVISIDGIEVGTFSSTGRAIVCINVTRPLADGPHLLTGAELRPHPTYVIAPFAFSVDTVPPAPPSAAWMTDYRDSGTLGDGITRFPWVNFTGTAKPKELMQLVSGPTTIGGARTDADGNWSVTTVNLPDGAYAVTAVTLDSAGNKSPRSDPFRLVIDSVTPPTPAAPTRDGDDVRGTVGTDVARVVVYADGTPIGETVPDGAGGWRYSLAQLAPGSHTITVTASDAADNGTPLSGSLTVTLDEPPPAPPPPPPPAELLPPPEELPALVPPLLAAPRTPEPEARPQVPEFAPPVTGRPPPPRR